MDAKKKAEDLASKLDCTWNGEQGRWVSENLIKIAIEEAKREERERCKDVVANYMFEEAEFTFQDNNFDFYETVKDMSKDLVEAIESEAGHE